MLMNIKHVKHQSGFTLIELLTALVINVVIFSALITIFLANAENYRETTNINRLNQQMQTAMSIMSSEIRRAGYWGNAQSDIGSATNNNPFVSGTADLNTGVSGTCIRFTYDRDSDGNLPSISSSYDDERYAFRLSNQAIQSRPAGASYSCTAASGNWDNITDPTVIQITALQFTINTNTVAVGPGNKSLIVRSVDISMTGRLTSDNTITKTITKHIRVMNDVFTDE